MAKILLTTGYDRGDFILFPAAAYNGNAFRCLTRKYPPMFLSEEISPDMPTTITCVPHLNEDGTGAIELNSAEVSCPCAAIWRKQLGKAIFVFTAQKSEGENIGIAYSDGVITLTTPEERKLIYRGNRMVPNPNYREAEPGGHIEYSRFEAQCNSFEEFYAKFFEYRYSLWKNEQSAFNPDEAKLIPMVLDKYENVNWNEQLGIYMDGDGGNRFATWQPGWCGGGMAGLPLMRLGGSVQREHALRTLEFLVKTQHKSGLFASILDGNMKEYGDNFGTPGLDNIHLARKSADILFFLPQYLEYMKREGIPFPEGIENTMYRTADCFVRLWKKYGCLGQFLDIETGDIVVPGRTSAAIAAAGLCGVFRWCGDNTYLDAAIGLGEDAYAFFHENGYTCGGPGEILQCPDSESAFGLYESMLALYETTQERKWLDRAVSVLYYCSSWVVPYRFSFPESSEFGRLDINTVGTVWANAQNKHSAPGICTLSTDSIRRCAEYTDDARLMKLYNDVSDCMWQCFSTAERPINSWDDRVLPPGYMCERVNMSDWEGPDKVGGVFYGSCWCEVSWLLTAADRLIK